MLVSQEVSVLTNRGGELTVCGTAWHYWQCEIRLSFVADSSRQCMSARLTKFNRKLAQLRGFDYQIHDPWLPGPDVIGCVEKLQLQDPPAAYFLGFPTH